MNFLSIVYLVTTLVSLQHVAAIDDAVFFFENSWYNQTHVGYIAHFKIPVQIEVESWTMVLVYEHPVSNFEVWQGDLLRSNALNTAWYFKGKGYNSHLYPGSVVDQRFQVEFRRQPNKDYRIYKGQRPLIIFRNNVYRPNPVINDENPMEVFTFDEMPLPEDLEIPFVPEAITKAPTTTLVPLTRGPDSGIFWWVRTKFARPTRPTTTARTTSQAATVATLAPTTTTTEEPEQEVSCSHNRMLRERKCVDPKRCFIPACSTSNSDKFVKFQCWKFQRFCWCVSEYTGKKTSDLIRYRLRGKLPCLTTEKPLAAPITEAPSSSVGNSTTPPPRIQPPFSPRMNYDYNLVISYSILFFESQRSGDLSKSDRIPWRKSSHMTDGDLCGHDLSGGYYVSGDYVKYSFPTAAAMTLLAWGFIEFPKAYESAEQVEHFKATLRWGADYFMKSHVSKYKLYGQVGDSSIENSFWELPQDMNVRRPCFAVGVKSPGSDLAAEVSAALASTAKVLMMDGARRDDPYVMKLLDHARDLYDFALKYRQIYSLSIRQARDHYNSNGYHDELVWASLWLYEATGERSFLVAAGKMYDEYKFDGTQYEATWDNKIVAVQLLLSKLAPQHSSGGYLSRVKQFCDYNLPDGDAPYTPEGFLYISQWGASRYSGNAAFICLVASKSHLLQADKQRDYRQFAEDQVDYLLGKMGKSYMIGFGKNFPLKPHHRSSSCPRTGACGWVLGYENTEPNPYMLIGALVGGPDVNDNWSDDRSNHTTNGVSLNQNAGFQGAVAGLKHFQLEYEQWRQSRKSQRSL